MAGKMLWVKIRAARDNVSLKTVAATAGLDYQDLIRRVNNYRPADEKFVQTVKSAFDRIESRAEG